MKTMDEAVERQQDDRGQWFVIQTLSGHENKVRDTINRQLRIDRKSTRLNSSHVT